MDLSAMGRDLEKRFAEAIEPVLANVPQRMMAAIEPALKQLERRMAHVVQQQAEEVLALERGASLPEEHQDRREKQTPASEGESQMPTRTTQNRRQQSRGKTDEKQEQARGGEDQEQERGDRESRHPTYRFDAAGAARVGLLNLADTMRDYGATYQAINAYERILARYPGTGAADIATEELVKLAGRLQKDGKIYTALNIFNKLEQYV
jgi:hypothetical protein